MNKKSVIEIRQAFLDFFSSKGHEIISGSSLLPEEDSSLLFTNSGMNQFKDIFLGLEIPVSRRVVTVQRCVRAGGKHNDLENVGYTGHHLTFFEMLGNFSFGDYFKEDAIYFAWELLTSSHWFNLSKDHFLITVHINDKESYNIWKNKIGILSENIICIDNKKIDNSYYSDNFWQMSNIGPCGYCSEIFYNYNGNIVKSSVEKNITNKSSDNHYIEIWNLVFMEFNRQFDGVLLPLPMLSVDTGMGLERIASVLQSVSNNYEIDLFYHLMMGIIGIIGDFDFVNPSFRVITDHIRACSFLISDGVFPSNIGHGYVLRRIVRRAIRHGKLLGIHGMFFYKLVDPLIKVMGGLSDKLVQNERSIKDILFIEEKKFSIALEQGLEILNLELSMLNVGDILNGDRAFYFYSTYGFPLQFTKNICLKNSIIVDEIGFNRAMLIHKQSAQKSNKFIFDRHKILLTNYQTDFVGYEKFSCFSKIIAVFKEYKVSTHLLQGESGIVVLDKTPFYGEAGGQIGDSGSLKTEFVHFEVFQTKKCGRVVLHFGKVISGILKCRDHVISQIDEQSRKYISLNHSATHLLNSALSSVLGNHVLQKGSFINNQYIRFDFSHRVAMSLDQITLVENIVNQKIRDNVLIDISFSSIDIAFQKGAKSLPGKQYNQLVRVLSIGNFSIELCGGTHAARTGDIGLFVILKEFGIAYGIRRIEAVCAAEALLFFNTQRQLIRNIGHKVKGDGDTILNKIECLCDRVHELENQLERFWMCQVLEETTRLIKKVYYVGKIKFIVDQVNIINLKMLRILVNILKDRLISGIIVVFFINSEKVLNLVVGVTKDLIYYVNAVEIVNYLNSKIGGKGGGRPELAQSCGGNVKLSFNIIEVLKIFLVEKFEYYNTS